MRLRFILPLLADHQVPAARETFRKFRTPGEGEQMILGDNAFVERVLPDVIGRSVAAWIGEVESERAAGMAA